MFLKARLAILCLFLVHGLIISTWASRLPVIQSQLGISTGTLGLLLLSSAIGALLSMPLTGRIMARRGSRNVGTLASLFFCAALPCLAWVNSIPLLVLVLFVYGFSAGAMDVAMNAQAVYLEKTYQRSIMVTFHAFFSLGGMLGALIGSFIASQKMLPLPHFLWAAGVFMILIGTASRYLLADAPVVHEKGPMLAKFSWPLAGLCVVGFCCFLSEGVIIDWSGIYLYRVFHSVEAIAALAYASFSVAMTFGRFVGDTLAERFPPATLVMIGCGFAIAGMLLVLLGPVVLYSLAGFALVGLGFSVIVPLVFSASGKIPGNSNTNLTTITLFSYAAFLLGPPLIGLMAQAFDLKIALAFVLVLTCIAASFARIAFPSAIITRD